ncbi:cell division control protein 48 c-like [Trifolium pratense]|uniref:Cell division control protein 48 c-like n=1 Tax=Trifolium pratense TaxID=57577 RepID=A0A2K3NUE1_TRIPR|nr:cell division control protein 48 c-like [Trifolium pratense]
MGRRFQQQTLLPRIDSCKSKFSTADEIVHYLRSTYPDYHRVKSQTLLYYVNIALLSSNNNNKPAAREQIDQTASQLTKLSLSENNGGGDAGGGNDVKNVKKVENVVKNVVKRPMFKDLGGNGMEKIKNELEAPLMLVCQPKLCREFGLKPITGILLHGPPGCGKTRLAHAIANEAELPFYPISATQVVTGVAGESENNIRELFSKAKKTAPSIIFIDEIDAIAKRGENSQRQMETRIVTQLLTCMDEACSSSGSSDEPTGYVLVIGATNRLDAIDSALRRPGRFALEIDVGIPDESAREAILFLHTRNCSDKLDSSVDLQKIARSTPGFVGADLEALVGKAGERALDRIIDERKHELSKDLMSETNAGRWKKPWLPQEINRFTIKMTDFEEAVKMAQPSLTREGFSPVPDVKWEDVGALDHVDAMTTTEHGNEGGRVIDGIRKQLQIELDGAEQRKGVFVIGATNRPEVIDSALLRPGRFGNHIYIPVPSTDGRVSILKALAMHKEALARRMENRARFKLMRIDASVDLSSIARLKACENFSGADLAALMDKAILAALEEKLTTTEKKSDTLTVESRHFEVALSKVSPSVSEKQMEYYEDISKLLKAA